MELSTVFAYLFGLILLCFAARLLMTPLKWVIRLLFNAVVGGVLLWLLNLVGQFVGVHMPINPFTALIAGMLGIPGIALLFVLQYFMVK